MIHTLTTRRGTLYQHDDSPILIEDDGSWIALGVLDSTSYVLVDAEEWTAFMELITAVDCARQERKA